MTVVVRGAASTTRSPFVKTSAPSSGVSLRSVLPCLVVSLKGGRATIGVQRTSSDPHIETFDDPDLSGLAQEVLPVIERARARWEEVPKYPAHVRPAPPARRRARRGQDSAPAEAAEGAAEQQQPETLRLF